jgi:glycosyltransferase involved in cell wall biosynthesis
VGVHLLPTPFDRIHDNLAKLWFEQVGVPHVARKLREQERKGKGEGHSADLVLHVPYFAPPFRCAVPVVTTIPDIIPLVLPEYRGGLHVRAYMSLVRRTARRSAHTLTFSQHSRSDLVTHLGLPPQQVSAILLAAEERYRPQDRRVARQQVAERYGLEGPFIYYVGGLDARKHVGVLVQALALLNRQGGPPGPPGPPALLAIAGRSLGRDRRLFPDLDALIEREGVGEQVRRIEVPYADGPLLYQACAVFAFPSRYEGFGLPPLEAMACGSPVVASSASSLPEVVGDAALLVDPDDVEGWAAALGRLLYDEELGEEMQRRGLARAARFSWQRVARETLQVYEQVGRGGERSAEGGA